LLDFSKAGQGLALVPLKPWLTDPLVSEILINRPQEVFIEKNGAITRYEVPELTQKSLSNLFQVIAVANQQTLDRQRPILYGSLLDGSRVTLVIPSTSLHHTLSIRRKVVKDFKLHEYLEQDFYRRTKLITDLEDELSLLDDKELDLVKQFKHIITIQDKYNTQDVQLEIHNFIKQAVVAKKNIVFSGGTSSGKTTYLNACIKEIPTHERIITIESPRELEVTHPNYVSLLASKGGQGEAKVTNQDLVKSCMRLRPDRIIMGEIIGGEIIDFVSACTTGHEGSITTIHANNPKLAFSRMAGLYKHNQIVMTDNEIITELKGAIDIIIQLGKEHDGRMVQSIWYKYSNLVERL
jgi:type IV secretion system protein VirB11